MLSQQAAYCAGILLPLSTFRKERIQHQLNRANYSSLTWVQGPALRKFSNIFQVPVNQNGWLSIEHDSWLPTQKDAEK